MNRLLPLVMCLLTVSLLFVPASAEDPPKKLTADERKELALKMQDWVGVALKATRAGKTDEEGKAWAEALKIARQLYPKEQYPDGHENLAACLNNMAVFYRGQGKLAAAELIYREALTMQQRLFKGDNSDVATSLNNLAVVLKVQGKSADAETFAREALEMRKRLYPNQDNPEVALSLNTLAAIYRDLPKIAELAKGFRGKFEEVSSTGGDGDIKPGKDGKAHPLLWAAFTLSGPVR